MRRGGGERHVLGAVRYADRMGLCKTSLFIIPIEGKELCGAGTVWGGGGICSRTDGDTGALATGGGPAGPTVPTGIFPIVFRSLEAGPSLGEPSEDPAPSCSLVQPCQGLCSSRSGGQCSPPEGSAGTTSAISSGISSVMGVFQ